MFVRMGNFGNQWNYFCQNMQLGGRAEASPALFWKLKKVAWFWKKVLDCVHLWVKFSIQNVVLRVSRRKSSKSFSVGPFLHKFLRKCLSKCPNSMKPSLPWKISGCAPASLFQMEAFLIKTESENSQSVEQSLPKRY